MKIAVASNNHIKVSGHLGRCKSFVVFETNENNILYKEIRENTFRHHEPHAEGKGHHDEHGHEHNQNSAHNHNALIDIIRDCQYIIFQSGGWRILEDLQSNNIIPILTDEEFVEEAVRKLLAGELESKQENTCRHN